MTTMRTVMPRGAAMKLATPLRTEPAHARPFPAFDILDANDERVHPVTLIADHARLTADLADAVAVLKVCASEFGLEAENYCEGEEIQEHGEHLLKLASTARALVARVEGR